MVDSVILVVYGWKSVQPGTLSWVFPSIGAAVHAAKTMTNAVRWAILAGSTGMTERVAAQATVDLDGARALGSVLLERAE